MYVTELSLFLPQLHVWGPIRASLRVRVEPGVCGELVKIRQHGHRATGESSVQQREQLRVGGWGLGGWLETMSLQPVGQRSTGAPLSPPTGPLPPA